MTKLFHQLPGRCEQYVTDEGDQCGKRVKTKHATYLWGTVNGVPELVVLCDDHADDLGFSQRLTRKEVYDLRQDNLPEPVASMTEADWREVHALQHGDHSDLGGGLKAGPVDPTGYGDMVRIALAGRMRTTHERVEAPEFSVTFVTLEDGQPVTVANIGVFVSNATVNADGVPIDSSGQPI